MRLLLFALTLALYSCQTKPAPALSTKAALVQHIVEVDGHPISVWEKSAVASKQAVLLVHGRTWSAVPDFDLQVEGEDLSLMDGLVAEGYATYAIDLRGYGSTPRDSTEWATPDRSAKDIAAVIQWISEQKPWHTKPHLFGWSMGSTLSQLMAQRKPDALSSLTLFGYWRDSDLVFPEEPAASPVPQKLTNTAAAAASDFITPGSISQKAIDAYVAACLEADPVKTDLRRYDQFNELDPAKVQVPTLVLQGELDPIAPTEYQAKLFSRLGHGHKQWIVVKGGDHAAFMETPRAYFIQSLVNFWRGIPIE